MSNFGNVKIEDEPYYYDSKIDDYWINISDNTFELVITCVGEFKNDEIKDCISGGGNSHWYLQKGDDHSTLRIEISGCGGDIYYYHKLDNAIFDAIIKMINDINNTCETCGNRTYKLLNKCKC